MRKDKAPAKLKIEYYSQEEEGEKKYKAHIDNTLSI